MDVRKGFITMVYSYGVLDKNQVALALMIVQKIFLVFQSLLASLRSVMSRAMQSNNFWALQKYIEGFTSPERWTVSPWCSLSTSREPSLASAECIPAMISLGTDLNILYPHREHRCVNIQGGAGFSFSPATSWFPPSSTNTGIVHWSTRLRKQLQFFSFSWLSVHLPVVHSTEYCIGNCLAGAPFTHWVPSDSSLGRPGPGCSVRAESSSDSLETSPGHLHELNKWWNGIPHYRFRR